MKTIWKIIIITITAGLILSIIGFSLGASRVLYLDRTGVRTSGSGVSQITEMNLGNFKNIYVDVGLSDVELINSDRYGIDLYGEDMEWIWTIEGDLLRITHNRSSRVQIMSIDFFQSERNYAKIYIPENVDLETVTIKTSSGDIKLGSFTADKVEVTNSFGKVDLSNITSNQLKVDLSSGNFTGLNISTGSLVYNNRFGDGRFQSINAGSLKADSSSGDLQLTDCLFTEASISNSFGKITANGLTSTKSNIQASSGNIVITGDFTGETIVHADFGDIKLTSSRSREEYSFDISVRFGSIRFDGEKFGDQASITSGSTLENHLKITASSGDIEVNFAG